MDAARFDRLARTLTAPISRRLTLGGLAAGLLVALGLALEEATVLGKKNKNNNKGKGNKKNKKKKDCLPGRVGCGGTCCQPGQVCRGGQCRACNTDVDCDGAYFLARPICVAGRCEECAEDDTCALLRPQQPVCVDNTCQECRTDADCPDPEFPACNSGLCLECLHDGHCPPAARFCHGSGVCVPCLAHVDCPLGESCRGNQCVNLCGNGIRDGDEADVDCGGSCPTKCADGQTCFLDADCQGGFCFDGLTCDTPTCDPQDFCREDSDCTHPPRTYCQIEFHCCD